MRSLSGSICGRSPKPLAAAIRELGGVVQSRIPKPALPVHFQVCDERIPVRQRSPAAPGMEVYPRKAKSGRNQTGAGNIRTRHGTVGHLQGIKGFAVEKQLGVKFPGAPGAQNSPDGGLIGPQKVREYAEIGSERNKGAHVEIPVWPPVQSVADAASAGVGLNQAGAGGRQDIVDRGMTQGTLNPNRLERSGGVEEASHADDGIQFEQNQGRSRIVEIHLAMAES